MLLRNRTISQENYITYIIPLEEEFLKMQEEDDLRTNKFKTNHKSVSSSNIYSIGYDKDKKILDVVFKTNQDYIYRYLNVERDVFEDFINANSIGKHFRQYIMNNFASIKIEK